MGKRSTGHTASGSSTTGTTTGTTSTDGTSTHGTGSAAGAAERTAAIALWVVVGVALVYGVSETAVRVAALFA